MKSKRTVESNEISGKKFLGITIKTEKCWEAISHWTTDDFKVSKTFLFSPLPKKKKKKSQIDKKGERRERESERKKSGFSIFTWESYYRCSIYSQGGFHLECYIFVSTKNMYAH